MKPKLLNDSEAKRFAEILGYAIAKAYGEKGWGVLDLRDCSPWINDRYDTARDAAYDIAKEHIKEADARYPIAFNEQQYQHHFALHAACLKTIQAFKGQRFSTQGGEDGNDAIFAERIDTFFGIYQTECLERGAGVETE